MHLDRKQETPREKSLAKSTRASVQLLAKHPCHTWERHTTREHCKRDIRAIYKNEDCLALLLVWFIYTSF
jgi:hypothetical protein